MSKNLLKAGCMLAVTALLATNALAQETQRGSGKGNRDGKGQAADSSRSGGSGKQAKSGGPSDKSTATPAPTTSTATAKPTVTAASTPSTQPATSPDRGWWGRRASNATPGIDRTQSYQSSEIEAGRRRGLITDSEAKSLKAEQDRIAELERRAKADGSVSREERHQIRSAQRDAERHIREETFDHERERARHNHRRYWGGWWGGRGWW
jgi:hypothetical protein